MLCQICGWHGFGHFYESSHVEQSFRSAQGSRPRWSDS